jgi:hypothetical protein
MFEELVGSFREAGAILRGQKKPSRRLVIDSSVGVKANSPVTRLRDNPKQIINAD